VQISWMDSNLIQVTTKRHDTSGLACSYRGALGRDVYSHKL
jgi:hypothetical protein